MDFLGSLMKDKETIRCIWTIFFLILATIPVCKFIYKRMPQCPGCGKKMSVGSDGKGNLHCSECNEIF
ncbi:MAG: hypothetical protein NTZ97_05070 [Candidatus Moranbacteria bacterium]|nr:hypothetical protein [Candidatus Moranbacteria bacterium]